MTTFDHFAYGSNMSIDRLRRRCPSADVVAVGFVRQRQLRFHKIGRDGTGKADAVWTGNRSHQVWGIVYRCCATEKYVLDQCESLGIGYESVDVEVNVTGQIIHTYLYEAKPNCIDSNLRPAAWYHLHCVTGARQHSLPLEYQRMIESHYDDYDESSSLPPLRGNG